MPPLDPDRKPLRIRLTAVASGIVLAAIASVARCQPAAPSPAGPEKTEPPILGRGLQWLLEGDWLPPSREEILRRRRPPDRRPPDRRRTSPVENESDAEHPPLDDTLQSDVQLIRALQQIETLIEREKWPEVVAGLQQLLEGETGRGDTFVRSDRQLQSLRGVVEDLIAQLPAPALRLYQEVYGPIAADLLADARKTGDLQRLVDVARRFLHTPSGESAALDLASAYFDRAEYLASIRWFERVPAARRARTDAVLQIKYALALSAADRRADAERVIAGLDAAAASQLARSMSLGSLSEWWRACPKPELTRAAPQLDWPLFYGNLTHTGMVRAASPLLLEEWSLPSTYIPAVARQIEALRMDLRDARRAPIPAMFPLIIGDRMAVRTLRGVEVVDLQTGRPLWAQPLEPATPERLISGSFDGEGDRSLQFQIAEQARYGESANPDEHPLTSLLYRDTVSGVLSADGGRLFVLTHHAVLGRPASGYLIGRSEESEDPFGRDWSTNVLTAFDLDTGEALWEVGGPRTGEPFERSLAGTYFFGPPVPAEDELYAVGERDNEVCLFVLDRLTGRPVYVQPLANSPSRIDFDMTRRLWACQPAIAGGLVICPTTTGWTVAVDRLERRLAWAWKCENTPGLLGRRQLGELVFQPLQPLNVRWEITPPIVSGQFVILTPPELPDVYHAQEPHVVCLDLLTGRELWRIPKEDDGLYVGAVADGHVLVVGRSRVQCFDLAAGKEQWTLTLPIEASPSGRGLVIGENYCLPLSNGRLWQIRLSDGDLVEKLELERTASPLGNLAMFRGRLISCEPLQVRCFSNESSLLREIARRREADPRDLWSATRQARLLRMHGDCRSAFEELSAVSDVAASPTTDHKLANEYAELLRDCLVALVSEDLAGRDAEYARLTEIVDPRSDPDLRRLAVERALSRRNGSAAWRLLWPSVAAAGDDPMLTIDDRRVRTSAWESARLAELYALASPDLRKDMDQAFSTAVDQASAAEASLPDGSRLLESLLAFHPAGWKLIDKRAIAAEAASDFAGAELRWRRLAGIDDPDIARRATLRLAEWLLTNNLPFDARQVLEDARARRPVPTADDESDAEWRDLLARVSTAVAAASSTPPDWSQAAFSVFPERRQQSEPNVQDVLIAPGGEPFYDRARLQFLAQSQRLTVSLPGRRDFWSLPLPNKQNSLYDQTVALRTDGLQAYAVWQGTVMALSWPDRRVRWTYPIELRLSGANYIRNATIDVSRVLLPADQFAGHANLRRYRSPTGMAAAAGPDYVLLHGRRAITLLDASTGDIRWTRSGLSPQTMVYGDGPRIYGFPLDGSEAFVLNTLDGGEVPDAPIARIADHVISLLDGRAITIEHLAGFQLPGLISPKMRIASVDLQSGKTLWSHDITRATRVGWLSADQLALLTTRGQLMLLNLDGGSLSDLGVLPPDVGRDPPPVEMLADHDSIYLLFNRDSASHVDSVNFPHVQINGAIVCFARDGAGVRWNRSVADQRLLTSQFERLPVLAFFTQTSEEQLHQLHIELWDKRTGRSLLKSDDLRVSAQTYQLEVDLEARALTFIGHNVQLRVAPQEEVASDPMAQPAPAEAPAPAPPGKR